MNFEALAKDLEPYLELLESSLEEYLEDCRGLPEDPEGCRTNVVNDEIMLDVPARKVEDPEEFAQRLEQKLGASVTHLHKLHGDRHGVVSEMLGGYSQDDTQVFSISHY